MTQQSLHWKTVDEVKKLGLPTLVPGVVETDIYRENLLDRLPGGLVTGTSVKWNREKKVLDTDVAGFESGGEEVVWTSDMEYDLVEYELKKCYMARLLDHFDEKVYGTINDYKAQGLLECHKGIQRKLGFRVIYDDNTYGGSKQFDGLHALAAEHYGQSTTGLNIDQGGPLSLFNMRYFTQFMKYGIDFWYMPFEIALRIDAAYEEAGLARLMTSTAGPLSMITRAPNANGDMVTYFGGKPIVRTDYLVAEQDGTGTGATSNARAIYSSGTKTYSIFAVKMGNVLNREPGLGYFYGDSEMTGNFYKLVNYDDVPTKVDARGVKLLNYSVPLLGGRMALGRIFDITDAEVVY